MSLNIDVEILSSKSISHRKWYLCRCNLLDYLNNLKDQFYEFAIQRRIVKNQYLDTLYQTIKSGDPIPVITLTYDGKGLENTENNKAILNMNKVEILDGLQRTFRLWSYKKMSETYEVGNYNSPTDFAKHLKNSNPLFFETGVISTSLIRLMLEKDEMAEILSVFSDFDIYLVIWAGLDENEIIQKMLVLNAGQKAVSKTHQFELLFLHSYNEIKNANNKISLVREKEKNAFDVKKGKREIGQFMFSSVIVALQSFAEKRPQRISTDNLIDTDPELDTSPNLYDVLFSSTFLDIYLDNLYELDKTTFEVEGERGKEWFVKDTTLSGIFAALGKHIDLKENWNKAQLAEFAIGGFNNLRDAILHRGLKLEEFTEEYNYLSSRSVNIGNFIRRAVMIYISELLNYGNPSWKQIFDSLQKRSNS